MDPLKLATNDRVGVPTRRLNWKSCLDAGCRTGLLALQEAMRDFYQSSSLYYGEIDFAADTWADETQLEAQDILREAGRHSAILEVGCGRANILKSGNIEQRQYTGIDFAPDLIGDNQSTYPQAAFHCIDDSTRFPVATGAYDYAFSHYVLEHCVFPNLFLDECVRVLRPGGLLGLLCPDFLGTGRMSSQRAGFSPGTGREKLSRGQVWDAVVTGYDSRIRIPLYASRLRAEARRQPRFFINMSPTCFTDPFGPDVDAVYLTFADEIRSYLAPSIVWESLEKSLADYGAAHAHIYLKGRKKASP